MAGVRSTKSARRIDLAMESEIVILETRLDAHELLCDTRHKQIEKRLWRIEAIIIVSNLALFGLLATILAKG